MVSLLFYNTVPDSFQVKLVFAILLDCLEATVVCKRARHSPLRKGAHTLREKREGAGGRERESASTVSN